MRYWGDPRDPVNQWLGRLQFELKNISVPFSIPLFPDGVLTIDELPCGEIVLSKIFSSYIPPTEGDGTWASSAAVTDLTFVCHGKWSLASGFGGAILINRSSSSCTRLTIPRRLA